MNKSKINWPAHIANQAKSGLGVKAYCRKYGLGISSYYGYKKKIKSKNNSDFVEIKVDKPRKPSQKKGIEVSVDDDGFCHFKGDLKSLLKIARMLGDEA